MTLAGRGPQVMGVFLLFLTLTTIATGLRVYCRAVVIKLFGWDDWLALVAWILFVCHAFCAIVGVYHGTGQHAWLIEPPSDIVLGLKWWWICEPLYVLSNMAIKASIALQLLRLLVDVTQRTILLAVLVVTELYSLSFFFIFLFQCIPSSYFWTRFTGAEGTCLATSIVTSATYVYSAITCVGDWVYSILPFIIVCNLEQLAKREKVMVGVILAMSAVASIATIARIPYIQTMSNEADFLHATTDVAIWSCTETGLAITACCCATLRPLIRHLLEPARTRLTTPRASSRTRSWQSRTGTGPLRNMSESTDDTCLSPDLENTKSIERVRTYSVEEHGPKT
ncbi:hypothetical protein Slin15195_G008800 [Septoria linicola]|uniref:Rhodopsin domain-containing protein n=1 Tax=Septoria linicola TaxID=215465 RepID=A0A9Q9AMM5_9PEZI|nr:hypothetical protein Slin14017_G008810 [Septoria linicola]USW47561.1 hypothetical protein Slin15195_G008800 [Septoria linicola]